MSITPPTYNPIGDQALEDVDLEKAVQEWLVRVSGLTPSLCRPAWQEEPPAQPGRATNWLSFHRSTTFRSWDPWIRHQPAVDPKESQSTVARMEEFGFDILVRGPGCDGIYNRISLAAGLDTYIASGIIKLIEIGDPVPLAVKEKLAWLKRTSFEVVLRRTVSSAYTVPDLAGASISVMSDVPDVDIVIEAEDA